MEYGYIFIGIVVLVGVGTYYFFFSDEAFFRSILSKMPSKKIPEVKDCETVRIRGKVKFLGRTIKAPLSKRDCVYYHLKVEDSSSRKDILKNYIHIEEERAGDVIIEQEGHYAIVSTSAVKSSIVFDQEFYSGFFNITSPELKEFLVKHGEKPTGLMGWSLDLIADEGVLEENEIVIVAGKASWRKTSEFRFKIPGEKVLYISATEGEEVYLTDDPGMAS